jgi:lipopolysaccharide/colanic/teichoic acid biosynthesis glycosyltransferase
MTIAEMNESQFLTRLESLGAYHDESLTRETVVESQFFRLKQILDRLLAIVMLIPALPLICLLVIAIRLTSRGPGIFTQARVGQRGRIFTMYKLRSMRVDAEAGTGPVWANVARDPRVTLLGHWLRRLHLDELPQLLNVVRGEMSLVGPRPERPEFVAVLAEQVPGYLNRIMVQPGITGLAQVNLPPDTDLDSVKRKVVLDCEYIRTASLFLDLRIITGTLLRLFGMRGGSSARLLGLHRSIKLHAGASPAGGVGNTKPATPHTLVAVERPILTRDRQAGRDVSDVYSTSSE